MLAAQAAVPPELIATAPNERSLIEQAQRDPAAMTQLYRMHCAAIHGYVLRRVGNGHDADDLTAEVFLAKDSPLISAGLGRFAAANLLATPMSTADLHLSYKPNH